MSLPPCPPDGRGEQTGPVAGLTRRRFLLGLGTLGAVTLGLAACGGASTAMPPASSAPSAAPATSAAPASSAPAASAAPTAAASARPSATTAAATPSARAAATSAGATPSAQGLRLVPLKPVDLGAPPVPPGTVVNAASAVPHDPAVALYDNYGTDAPAGVFPRTIRHATGTTELKTKPTKVLPLDSGELDSVVQLGLKPAGYLDYNAALMPDYLVAALQGVKTVGTLAEPNLEAVAAIAPELMLTSKLRHEKIADRLKAIAPTVFGERTGVVWKQNFALHARALGREVEGDTTVRAYEDRVRKLNAALPTPRPTVSIIRVLDTHLRYYARANYSGTILTDLGFPRPAPQNLDDFGLLNQSLETLGPIGDADLIILSPIEGQNGKFLKEMLASPLWQNLGAVKRGAVMMVLDDVWMAGIGYRSANTMLDDIARYFKV